MPTVYWKRKIGRFYNYALTNRKIIKSKGCFPNDDAEARFSSMDLTIYDGMTTDEMDQATINAAIQNIKDVTLKRIQNITCGF